MEEIFYQAAYGAIAGGVLAAAGWFKSQDKYGRIEAIELKKFLKTVTLGIVIGGIAGYSGLQKDLIASAPIYSGLTYVIESLFKGFSRHAAKN